jgi:type I restriction enzyme S subunit
MSFPRYSEYKIADDLGLECIPSHWASTRFSRVLLGIKDGTHGTFTRVADGRPLLSAKNVLDGKLCISEGESLVSYEDHKEIISSGYPARGDLLLTIVGTIGRCCVYELDEPVAFQRSVCFLRLGPIHSPRFFCYFIQSRFFQEQLLIRSKSAVNRPGFLGGSEP